MRTVRSVRNLIPEPILLTSKTKRHTYPHILSIHKRRILETSAQVRWSSDKTIYMPRTLRS